MTNKTEGDQQIDSSVLDADVADSDLVDTDLDYGTALEELEELLDELEGADIDVDRLAERVARGAELVRFCRARLDVVTKDVDAVVAELISVEELTEDTD
ncbi:MAG: exodeoxyribonuclease VII small subunit [Acidimicrobiales bacterium]